MSLPKPYYDDGKGIVIYNGDCREILPQLGKFDLLLTDPPYGLGKKLTGGNWGKRIGAASTWDSVTPCLKLPLSAAGNAIIWGGNYFPLPPSRCWLVWIKRDAVPTASTTELAWTTFDACAKYCDVTIADTNKERNGHPTLKPLKLISWCLTFAPNAQTVIDPFMGSGTTLRACKDLWRKCVGIELSEKYCEIAAQRLSQEVLITV